MRFKEKKGITLIAIVVTIIVLIILAAVSINLIFGEYSIIQRAKQSKEASLEQSAREKLELELRNLLIEKETTTNYNDAFFDNYLNKKGFIVNDNIVIIEGWQFQVDKSVPKIVASLGKGEEIKQIELTADVEYATDYTKATLKVGITYEGNIIQIKINGEEIEIPTKTDNKYELEKEILTNGKYSIYIKDEKNGYKITSISLSDISEDTTISTVEELVAFRDRVNRGATYNGKTVTLTRDLDLSSVCGQNVGNWIPIGATGIAFQGTFEGNKHTINNLYINSSDEYTYEGLFYINNGIIQNVILNNINIYNSRSKKDDNIFTGGIAGRNSKNASIINCGIESGSIIGYNVTTITSGWRNVITGGIIGWNSGNIINCYNKASIKSQGYNDSAYNGAYAGGIAGVFNGSQILNCYNIGTINAVATHAYSGGIIGQVAGINSSVTGKVGNCYSTGNILASYKNQLRIGGIIGENGYNNSNLASTVTNCYCGASTTYSQYYWNGSKVTTTTNGRISPTSNLQTYASILGDAYTNDIKDADETWKYNNGYPILK